MISLSGIVKLARGGIGVDELKELLTAVGMDLKFTSVPAAAASFHPLAESASLPCAELLELRGTMKGGGSIHALLVMNHKGKQPELSS